MNDYIMISLATGVMLVVLDIVLNSNPLARILYEVFRPISRRTINPVPAITIDLIYGFVIAGLFLLLYSSLPGETGLLKGTGYAVILWFFRVVMNTASQWVMFNISGMVIIYSLISGLLQMLIIGVLLGLTLTP